MLVRNLYKTGVKGLVNGAVGYVTGFDNSAFNKTVSPWNTSHALDYCRWQFALITWTRMLYWNRSMPTTQAMASNAVENNSQSCSLGQLPYTNVWFFWISSKPAFDRPRNQCQICNHRHWREHLRACSSVRCDQQNQIVGRLPPYLVLPIANLL